MALKSFNPYTASRRFVTMLDKSEITKQTPEKSLVEPKKRSGGRNAMARSRFGIAAAVTRSSTARLIFAARKRGFRRASRPLNTTRTARHALRCCTMRRGEALHLASIGLEVGMTVQTGEGADILPRKRHADPVHPARNAVAQPGAAAGKGAQAVRAAGGSAQLLSKEGDIALVKLPSGEVRKFGLDCMATIGQVGTSTTRT